MIYNLEVDKSIIDLMVSDFETLGLAMLEMKSMCSETIQDIYCYQKKNKKYVVVPFSIGGAKIITELHYARPLAKSFEELQRNNPSLKDNPINVMHTFNEKCPSHELPTPIWSDKLGQYPELKESDVMDVYVFINGVPWRRK